MGSIGGCDHNQLFSLFLSGIQSQTNTYVSPFRKTPENHTLVILALFPKYGLFVFTNYNFDVLIESICFYNCGKKMLNNEFCTPSPIFDRHQWSNESKQTQITSSWMFPYKISISHVNISDVWADVCTLSKPTWMDVYWMYCTVLSVKLYRPFRSACISSCWGPWKEWKTSCK